LVENVMGRELVENVRIPSYGERGSKIAEKNRHMIFERSPTSSSTTTKTTREPSLENPCQNLQWCFLINDRMLI